MAVTKTETIGWGSRLGDSVKGILFGFVMFIAGFPLLFWNEGNTVKTAKALEEGEGACVAVESNAQIDPEMNDQLVHMTGLATTDEVLSDAEFGVNEAAIKLRRNVEMYQWQEESHTTEKKKMGGGVERTTTYTYSKVWADRAIDSGSFEEAGHDNPGAMEFQSDALVAKLVNFGAFRLSEGQISRIGDDVPYVFPTNYVCPIARVKVQGRTIYVPNAETRLNELNNRDVVAQPRIGDMRVTFSVVKPHEISLVAKQHGDTFVPYVAKTGKKVTLLSDGVKDAAEMFADAQSANTTMCWLLRLVGFMLMFVGVKMVLKPISVLGDVLPILGDILGIGIGIVAFAVAAPCALITIAIAWFFYRPVASIILLAVAGGIFYLVWRKRKAKKPAQASSLKPDPAELRV